MGGLTINEATKTISNCSGQFPSCRDYQKMLIMKLHTGEDYGTYGRFINGPLSKDYTGLIILDILKPEYLSLLHEVEDKYKVQHTVLVHRNTGTIVIGDPIWQNSVELYSMYLLLLRGLVWQSGLEGWINFGGLMEPNPTINQYKDHFYGNANCAQDIKDFIWNKYQKIDSLDELQQFGIIDAPLPKDCKLDKGGWESLIHGTTGILRALDSTKVYNEYLQNTFRYVVPPKDFYRKSYNTYFDNKMKKAI
jgi:hypothetical protein